MFCQLHYQSPFYSYKGLFFRGACFSAHAKTSQVMLLFYITWEVYAKLRVAAALKDFCPQYFPKSVGPPGWPWLMTGGWKVMPLSSAISFFLKFTTVLV